MLRTVYNRAIMAAVVEPVGLNAYWSVKHSPGGGCMIAGYVMAVAHDKSLKHAG